MLTVVIWLNLVVLITGFIFCRPLALPAPCSDEVLDVSSNGGDVVVDGMVLFPLVLRTAAGVVQLLLDSQMHCKVWKNAIEGILSDQNRQTR